MLWVLSHAILQSIGRQLLPSWILPGNYHEWRIPFILSTGQWNKLLKETTHLTSLCWSASLLEICWNSQFLWLSELPERDISIIALLTSSLVYLFYLKLLTVEFTYRHKWTWPEKTTSFICRFLLLLGEEIVVEWTACGSLTLVVHP